MLSARLRRRRFLLLVIAASLLAALLPSLASAATTPAYITAPGASASVDTIQDGTSVSAPWNSSQGVTSFDSLAITPYPSLLPTFSFSGEKTSFTNSSSDTPASESASEEPNVAVYPSTSGTEPFPSGFAGTPGPLSGYCGSSYSDSWDTSVTATGGNLNETSSPVSQPSGETLPFAPYYFPYVVRNSDGTLTGYFDWRPKDADEAIVSATSSDNGKTWTATGEALEQNAGYCPSGDTNDDGLGHPFVAAFGSQSFLYTLQRADGDYTGTNLDAYSLGTSTSSPLSGVPSKTSVGVDPNTFATVATPVATAGAVSIPVSTLGGDAAGGNSRTTTDSNGNSLTQLDVDALPGGTVEYEDMTQATAGTQPTVITCTGTSGVTGGTAAGSNAPMLTGCTSGAAITVNASDDLVEVIGTASAGATIPAGPQNEKQNIGPNITVTMTSKNSNTLTYLLNANAPNRYYIGGNTVYCVQGNAEPTTKIEDCTIPGSSSYSMPAGTPITADPAIPSAGANYSGGPVTQTNGLISPDGIIGALPSSANSAWGQPSTGKVVLYTEKKVNYFIEGGINGTVTAGEASTYSNDAPNSSTGEPPTSTPTVQTGKTGTLATGFVPDPGSTPTNYNISQFPTQAEALPSSGSFNVYIGYQNQSGSSAGLDTLTCTGWDVNVNIADLYNPNLNTIDLLGCTGGTGSDWYNAGHQGNWVAGPGAAIETANSTGTSVLQQIGEGKAITAGQAQKLFGNNEDYEVVRAAYTTDGINFTDLGAISGSTSGSPALNSTTSAGGDTGSYSDISNPYQQASPAGTNSNSVAVNALDASNPQGDAPANVPVGGSDTVELRWPGARGTIVTEANGNIGMFLSGAWASDGDSDAFNQIFFTQSADGGKTWSVPTVVQSTDYTFAASAAADGNPNTAMGVSAYYSGRAYDPTVVQNPDGTLTMVFAGYRLPNPVKAAGTALGTNSSALYCSGFVTGGCSASNTTVTQTDPALYRNILSETLLVNQAPTVTTTGASALTTTSATVAGTVLTEQPSTSVSIQYGPTIGLGSSVTLATLGAGESAQNVSTNLTGLQAGTKYYYEVTATNYSGPTVSSMGSFTTASAASTTTTPAATTTTPPFVTTVSTGKPAVVTHPKHTVRTFVTGNRKVTVTVPYTGVCLAASAKLSVEYANTHVSGSTAGLSFYKATLTLDKKLRATVRRASETLGLSLKGLKKGTYTLKVVTTYHYKQGKRTRSLDRTANVLVKVC